MQTGRGVSSSVWRFGKRENPNTLVLGHMHMALNGESIDQSSIAVLAPGSTTVQCIRFGTNVQEQNGGCTTYIQNHTNPIPAHPFFLSQTIKNPYPLTARPLVQALFNSQNSHALA